MQDARLGLFLLCLLVGAGCASTGGNEGGHALERTTAAAPDSVQPPPPSTSKSKGEKALANLRTAYVRGDYEAVVRRAHEQLRDSLSGARAGQVQMLLGRAEQARGNHKQAIDALQAARVEAAERSQWVVRIDRALGESYGALYRWSSAASAFQRVLDSRPDDRAARQALAEAYRQSRKWRDAKQQYEQLVRRDSSKGTWWARLATCEVEIGEIGSAIQHFARAHQLLSHSADVALTLSRFYWTTMQYEAARKTVDSTLHHRPGDSRLWRRRADFAFERDHFERARRAYERAIATGDSSATAYRRRGMIGVKQGEHEEALASLHSSLRLDSTHARTTLYLGIAYRNLDSLQRASRFLQKTIDREAEGPITEAFVQRGLLNNRRGDVSAAVRAHKMALRLRPERTDVYFHLATVYDAYYREKKTAARYYHRFLQASDSTQMSFRTYAQDRLKTLRATLHMQERRAPTDSAPEE